MTMRLLPLLLGLAALCSAGCTTSYRVYVNAYSEVGTPPAKEVPIAVVSDPRAHNPVLGDQIKAKIERLLRNEGYNVAPVDKAEYRLSFQLGMRTGEVVGYVPYREHYWGGYGGWHRGYGYGFGYTTVTPYVDTYFDQWLTMRLAQARPGDPNEGKVVWVGEAVTQTEQGDIRRIVDYLLVADLQEFGLDTRGQAVITIREDDPRIQDIQTAP
jgi:hypothetical protein